jgi:hypothetical protein
VGHRACLFRSRPGGAVRPVIGRAQAILGRSPPACSAGANDTLSQSAYRNITKTLT